MMGADIIGDHFAWNNREFGILLRVFADVDEDVKKIVGVVAFPF